MARKLSLRVCNCCKPVWLLSRFRRRRLQARRPASRSLTRRSDNGPSTGLRAMNFPHFFIDRPIFAGVISIVITLLGTNLDTAQVLVQNRVAIAIPVLPPDVQRIGVT